MLLASRRKEPPGFLTLFLGHLLFVPHLILGDLWPRGVLLILWQESLLPLRGWRSHILHVTTQLLRGRRVLGVQMVSVKGASTFLPVILTVTVIVFVIVKSGKFLPVADSSFSKGKTERKKKGVRTRQNVRDGEKEDEDSRCRRLLSVVPAGSAPRGRRSPEAFLHWTDSPRY